MSRKVCMLSPSEEEDWRLNDNKPSCRDHRHCSVKEAQQMIMEGWMKSRTPYLRPLARIVGRNAILMTQAFSWRVVDRSYLPSGEKLIISTLQLLPSAS